MGEDDGVEGGSLERAGGLGKSCVMFKFPFTRSEVDLLENSNNWGKKRDSRCGLW